MGGCTGQRKGGEGLGATGLMGFRWTAEDNEGKHEANLIPE